MKIKLLILLGCISMMTGCATSVGCCDSGSYISGCGLGGGCGGCGGCGSVIYSSCNTCNTGCGVGYCG